MPLSDFDSTNLEQNNDLEADHASPSESLVQVQYYTRQPSKLVKQFSKRKKSEDT
jgi:hypothetical protein